MTAELDREAHRHLLKLVEDHRQALDKSWPSLAVYVRWHYPLISKLKSLIGQDPP